MQQQPQVTRIANMIPTDKIIVLRVSPHFPNMSSNHFVSESVIPEFSASSSDSDVRPSDAFVMLPIRGSVIRYKGATEISKNFTYAPFFSQ